MIRVEENCASDKFKFSNSVLNNLSINHRRCHFSVSFLLLLVGVGARLIMTAHAESGAPAIKILTFNIMWEEDGIRAGDLTLPVWDDRKTSVAGLITESAADIVGFQEASPEQQSGLRTELPGYTLVFHTATNNTNPIIFKSERFRLLDSGAFVLNTDPEIQGTNIGVRSSTWAHLEDRESLKRLWIYNLHLDHRSKGLTRKISAVRLMERLSGHSDNVCVTGDFNTKEASPTMTFLYGQSELSNDLGESVQNPKPLVNAYRSVHSETPRGLIDHVLAGPGVEILRAGRISTENASDHDLVWTEVSLD